MKFYFFDKERNIYDRSPDLYDFLQNSNFIISSSLHEIEDLYLFLDDQELYVSSRLNPQFLPTKVDLLGANLRHRLSPHGLQSELIKKCLGKKTEYKMAFDATAGMGTDSLLLAALGMEVVACERSPFIFLLLQNGLQRAEADFEIGRFSKKIHLVHQESLDYLSTSTSKFDVIYLDFMFSTSDKKSKSKKNMEIFKKIDEAWGAVENEERLNAYLSYPFQRLIYKRPLKSVLYKNHYYSHSVKGKAIRFDIYISPGINAKNF